MAWRVAGALAMMGPWSTRIGPGSHASLLYEGARCPEGPGVAAPTAPNYCADLIATPDLSQVTGVLELRPVSTPFGVAVTRDGRPRYRLAVRIDGLPSPSTLGDYSTYVAWVSTLSMDSVTNLGPVHNGETVLGEHASSHFRLIVSAERSARAATRSGRLVLRGTSPGARLLAHRDFLQAFGSSQSASHAAMAAMTWRMPPVGPGVTMMPGMAGLEPSTTPWSAGAGIEVATLPASHPSEVRRLRSGDTLPVTASLVQRRIAGHTFAAYAYNGETPGPSLVVPQGATIVVPFRNATDLPTTVHWHGVRLDNTDDGVDGVTQPVIAPGGTFTYHVRFPDAGIYWYHAHHREDIAQPLGLYGSILVTPSRGGDDRDAPVNRQEVLTIGDMLLDSAGPVPWGAEAPTHALMGRFGNVVLVNGQQRPNWVVHRGDVVRFSLINVSNARPYNLSFGAARAKIVGSDGGRFDHEAWVSSIVLAPAERYVADVQFSAAGDVPLTNRVEALDHRSGMVFPEDDTLATVHVSSDRATRDWSRSFARLHTDSVAAEEIARYRPSFDRPVDRELWLQMHVRDAPAPIAAMLNGLSVPVDWNDGLGMMNWVFTPREVTWVLHDRASGAENMDIGWHFRQGDVVKIRIANDAAMPHAMAHAIHLHGQRFLVLRRNGEPMRELSWKDTVLIPAGETVDLLFDLADPGRWLLHCHIAEHMEAQMMMVLTVDPTPTGLHPGLPSPPVGDRR